MTVPDIKTYRNKTMRLQLIFTSHQQQIYCLHTYRETLEQPIILNLHTKLNFSSNNHYFYRISLKNITDEFTLFTIRNL